MVPIHFSENLRVIFSVLSLALALTIVGTVWIDRLYLQIEDNNLLSFPDQIAQRSKYRKPLLLLLLFLCISKAWSSALLPAFHYIIIAIAMLAFVTVTDFEQYVIFDIMLLPFAIIGLCYTIHQQLPVSEHVMAGFGGGLSFLLLTLLTDGAIGGGDIKLIAAMGLWLGIRPLLSVITYGFLTGGAAALFLLITKQKKRHDYFAYGPYFALSGIGVLLGCLHSLF